ncbi:MAG: GC-type dockerin domain-anchored protein, partial [Planctomycetota bacterium]
TKRSRTMMNREVSVFVCVAGALGVAGSAAAQPATLERGSALIDAFSLTGIAASSVTIDERVEWDGLGSSFTPKIDEFEAIAGMFSGFTIDADTRIELVQSTLLDGGVGGAFAGVATSSDAFGELRDRGPDGAVQNSFADSRLELIFRVTEPGARYRLTGLLDSTLTGPTAEFGSNMRLRRYGVDATPDNLGVPFETPINTIVSRPSPEYPFEIDQAGRLREGLWVLQLSLNNDVNDTAPGTSRSHSGSWEIDFEIIPSCPADSNADGTLTPADFNAWVLAFNNQSPACDQNNDGFCTPADFNAWILNFNAGCP